VGTKTKTLVGWREWLALPDLGIEAIKAKIDTGARTSALHAFHLEEFEKDGGRWIRFLLHPLQRRDDIVLTCESPIADERVVRDSGGHAEQRYVIETAFALGGVTWPLEITLTNRDDMMFRMLLGRSALRKASMNVNPARSYIVSRALQKQQREEELEDQD